MTETSSHVLLDDGSSVDTATSAAMMQVDGRGEGFRENINVELPTPMKTKTLPLPKPSQSRVARSVATRREPSNPARVIHDKKIQPLSPEIKVRDPNLAHQAALRRLNGNSSIQQSVPVTIGTSPPPSGIEPVLVRSYTNSTPLDDPSRKAKMRTHRRSRVDDKACELPPLERFSFQDILASIDPDVKGSIDAIAEICGRSRMSLADQYGSHLPPQGELAPLLEQSDAQGPHPGHLVVQDESFSHSQLPRTSNHDHDRRNSASLGLVGNLHPRRSVTLSAPVVTTSNVNSQSVPNSSSEPTGATSASADPHSTILPQVLSWLRRSSASFAAGGHDGSQPTDLDYNSAADALHRILTRTGEPPPASGV
jgi:hypothetical protein